YVYGADRSCHQYCAGSGFYFRIWHGGEGSCHCYGDLPGGFCYMGGKVSYGETYPFAYPAFPDENKSGVCEGNPGPWTFRLYYGGHQLRCADRLQCHPSVFWWGCLCGGDDYCKFCPGGTECSGKRPYPGISADDRI